MQLLIEIKNRLSYIAIGMFCSFILCYYFKQTLLYLCIKPIILLKQNSNFFYFIFTNLIEVFVTYWLILQGVCFHFFIYFFMIHFYLFIRPSLYNKENYYIKTSFFILTFLWLLLSLVFYNIILPYFWIFFSTLNSTSTNDKKVIPLFFESKLSEYIQLLYNGYLLCCLIVFLFYIITNVIQKKIVVDKKYNKIKKYRKFLYFFFVVLATLITPPDIFSQILTSLFFFFTFELIMFCLIFNTKKVILNK